MTLLLDTHFAFWIPALRALVTTVELAMVASADEIVISTVSLWELRLKWNSLHASGSRKGPIDPEDLLKIIAGGPYRLLPLLPQHTVTKLDSPMSHRDPFDELLLAQAQAEGLRLLTRDRELLAHPLAIGAKSRCRAEPLGIPSIIAPSQ